MPFDALLALLGGTGPAATSTPTLLPGPPVPPQPGKPTGDEPAGAEPAPGSLEALLVAVAQPLSGVAPAVSRPAESTGGDPAVGRPADRRVAAAPPVPSQPGVPFAAGVSSATGPDSKPVPAPATDGRPHLGSAVAALAHSGDGSGSPSPVAALAHSVDHDDPGPPPAAAARHDGARPSESTGPAAAPDAVPVRLSRNPSGGRVSPASAPPRPAPAPPAPPGDVRRARSDEAGRPPEDDLSPAAALSASDAPAPVSAAPASEPRRPAGPAVSAAPASPFAAPAPVGSAGAPAEAPSVSSSSDTAPATPAAVADQIVSAVVPLHGRGDGRHEVTLELRPESLGTIRVELSVEHQTVHLTLHAAEPATGGLLSAALPDLRSALADAGLTTGHIGVGPGGHGAGHGRPDRPGADGDEPGRRRTGAIAGDDRGGAEHVPFSRPAQAGRLDVLL
jgi:flagellar hook-length control protein FliK